MRKERTASAAERGYRRASGILDMISSAIRLYSPTGLAASRTGSSGSNASR